MGEVVEDGVEDDCKQESRKSLRKAQRLTYRYGAQSGGVQGSDSDSSAPDFSAILMTSHSAPAGKSNRHMAGRTYFTLVW